MRTTLAVDSLTSGLAAILDRAPTTAGRQGTTNTHASSPLEEATWSRCPPSVHCTPRRRGDSSSRPPTLTHIDAHLDTLHAAAYPAGAGPDEEDLNHGTVLRHGAAESLIAMPSVYVGLNTRVTGGDTADLAADAALGFVSAAADVIEEGAGVRGLARRIADAVVGHGRSGKLPVFLSVDIDVLDRHP